MRIPLNLAASTSKESGHSFCASTQMRCKTISPGWYMIEVENDQTAIGMLINLKATKTTNPSEQGTTEISGWNNIQLGTTAISRRILYLNNTCNQITLSSNIEGINVNAIDIHLIRLTHRFARSRLISALEKWKTNTSSTMPTRQLYEHYQCHCPTPEIDGTYDTKSIPPVRSTHTTRTPVQAFAQWHKLLTVLIVDTGTKLPAHGSISTPFVLIADKNVEIAAEPSDFMRCIIHDSGDTQLWYSDHEHLEPCGKTVHPCYKPGWNPGLLQHGNYVGALFVCRQALFSLVGGMNTLAGQSVIYDFLLRASARLNHHHVSRVPLMVYRLPASSYHHPHGFFNKTDDHHALQTNIDRLAAPGGKVIPGPYTNTYAIDHNLPDRAPSVEIIIPTRDRVDLLETCVGSVFSITDYPHFQVTVVDNDSCEDATTEFHNLMSARTNYQMLKHPGTFNFSAINNAAVANSKADIVLMLNNDTEITQHDWLKRMVLEALQPDVACVGAKLFYSNGLVQHGGMIIGMQGIAGHLNRFSPACEDGYAGSMKFSADFSAVTAACMAIRRTVFLSLGGFDEYNLAVAFNDVDFCLRAREAGYRNRFLADVELIHHESVSRGNDNTKEKKERFARESNYMKSRHHGYISDDPAWNPNFLRCCNIPSLGGLPESSKYDQAA